MRYPAIVVVVTALALLGTPAPAQTIDGDAAHTACIEVAAERGQYVHAVLFENGSDLAAAVASPDGQELLKIDRSNRTQGRELITFIAPVTGSYTIEITPASARAAHARFELRIDAVRDPLPEDCLRLEAESALLDGDRLSTKDTAESLNDAGARYEEATQLAKRLGDADLEGEALLSLGANRHARGESRAAIALFTGAFDLARAANDRPLEAVALFHRGSIYGAMGNTREAFHDLESADQLYRELGDVALRAATANALAVRFKETGDIERATALYQRALSLGHASGDRLGLPVALNNLGNVEYDQGNWHDALAYFQQALPLMRDTGNHRGEAATLYNIGLVYQEQGELRRGLPYIEKALELSRRNGHRNGEAMCLYRLGLTAEDLGKLDDAVKFLSQALDIYRVVGDRRHEAVALVCLGRIHARRHATAVAFDNFDKALSIARATNYPWGEAFAHKHYGDAYAACGTPLVALDHYRQALAGFRAVGQHVWRARTLIAMAQSLDEIGQLGEARQTIEEALGVIERLQTNVTSRELKAVYLSSVRQGYELAIDLLMRLHDDREALHVSERARARSFLDLLDQSGTKVRGGINADLLQRQRALRQMLTAKIEQQFRRNQTRDASSADLTALTDELEQIEHKIRASNPHYATSTDRLLHAREIQKLLDDDTVLLEYALGEKRSFLWVVTPDAVSSYVLPARQRIETVTRRLLESLRDRSSALQNEASIHKSGRALADMLLRPAAARLQGKRLVIVSDGILHYVPFAVLPLWSAPDEPLIERFEIVSVPSASCLAALREQLAARRPPPKVLAVVADPVFRRDDPRIGVSRSHLRDAATVAVSRRRSLERGGDSISLARLPFTRREARAILSFVDPAARKEAFDFDASRATALDNELAQYRIVHFATHGFFNTARPELSGLVLSLVDEKGKDQEGFLLTSDVFGMNLRADLVVLSGCETALGREIRGEGITGLSRAFLFAGAARVVATLWKVDDAASAALMTQLYRGLFVDHLAPAAALRAAQAELRRSERWSSPYYWAGVVLQGDWK